MKKYLIVLMLLTGIVSDGRSQTSDTLCFPTPVIRRVLIAAEQGKVLKEQVAILDQRIIGLNSIIRTLEQKDSLTVAAYEGQIKAMQEQRTELERIIKRQRKNAFWSKVGGGLTTGILAYLLITK